MTSRRSFLQLLGLAPVAAPAIAKELAAPKFATGGIVGRLGAGQVGLFGRGESFEALMPMRGGASVLVQINRPRTACQNLPSIRRGKMNLAGLPERVSREKRKA